MVGSAEDSGTRIIFSSSGSTELPFSSSTNSVWVDFSSPLLAQNVICKIAVYYKNEIRKTYAWFCTWFKAESVFDVCSNSLIASSNSIPSCAFIWYSSSSGIWLKSCCIDNIPAGFPVCLTFTIDFNCESNFALFAFPWWVVVRAASFSLSHILKNSSHCSCPYALSSSTMGLFILNFELNWDWKLCRDEQYVFCLRVSKWMKGKRNDALFLIIILDNPSQHKILFLNFSLCHFME